MELFCQMKLKNTGIMDKLILNKKSNNSNNKSNISKVNYKKNLDCIINEHNIANQLVKIVILQSIL